jgi:hypothetical protein
MSPVCSYIRLQGLDRVVKCLQFQREFCNSLCLYLCQIYMAVPILNSAICRHHTA